LRSSPALRRAPKTLARRADLRLARAMPKAGQGLGMSQPQSARFPQARFYSPHASKAMQSKMMFPDRLLAAHWPCGRRRRHFLRAENWPKNTPQRSGPSQLSTASCFRTVLAFPGNAVTARAEVIRSQCPFRLLFEFGGGRFPEIRSARGPHHSRCERARGARSLRLAQRIIIGFVQAPDFATVEVLIPDLKRRAED